MPKRGIWEEISQKGPKSKQLFACFQISITQILNQQNAIQNEINRKIDEIELNVEQIDKQWEGVNELLLQITAFLIFNATSLLIAVFAITWTKGGTVFNRTLVLHSQETIGSLEANFFTIIFNHKL